MISLQNYSTYSTYSGLFEPELWLAKAKELGYKAFAFTDKHTTASFYQLHKYAEKNGIKPIYGIEFQLVTDEKEKIDRKDLGYILIYAKDEIGYKNLLKLNKISSLRTKEGDFYHRPKLTISKLIKHRKGLIAISPCLDGAGFNRVDSLTLENPLHLQLLYNAFGEDFYVGINPMARDTEDQLANASCLSLPYQKTFVYNTYYLEYEHEYLYSVVRKFDENKSSRVKSNNDRNVSWAFMPKLQDLVFNVYGEEDLYISEELQEECFSNLEKIVDKCTFKFNFGKVYVPELDLKGESVLDDLQDKALMFFHQKFNFPLFKTFQEFFEYEGDDTQRIYQDRLKKEIEVIEKINTDFFDYFHLLMRICEEHDKKFPMRGAARGSVGGSLFAYALDIIRMDPIYWDLSFERFLDESRPDYPDIDLDFSSEGRDYIIKEYLMNRYGESSVVAVASFKKLKIKSAIKQYHSAYAGGIPDNDGNIISYSVKFINELLDIDVPATLRAEKELSYMIDNSQAFSAFYTIHENFFNQVVLPLQETVSSVSNHASATMVTNGPAEDYFGVSWLESKEMFCSDLQFEDLEKMGFLKLDLLVLEAISVINRCHELIKNRHGNVVHPRFDELDFEDPKIMAIFKKGQTSGIFQYNTNLQQPYLKILQPDRFSYLPICVAILRTGPMSANAHNQFLAIANGEEEEFYENDKMEEILSETKGLLVYQEQVMKIGVEIAGMTPVQSNQLRRVLSKKKVDEVSAWKEIFIDGGLANSYTEEFLNPLFEKIAFFAEYAFNKSHSVGYAINSWYQGYLKANYPVEFWCAVLEHDKDPYSLKFKVEEEGYKFVFPTIKGFAGEFYPSTDTKIFWPLSKIKGMGSAAKFLSKNGNSFPHLDDFVVYSLERNENGRRVVTAEHYKILLNIGFFKPLGPAHEIAAQLFGKLDDIAHEAKIEQAREKHEAKQRDLYELAKEDPSVLNKKANLKYLNDFDPSSVKRAKPTVIPPEFSEEQDIAYWANLKNEAYGFEVSKWKDLLEFDERVVELTDAQFREIPDGATVHIAGRVTNLFIEKTKSGRSKGQYYATLYLEDGAEKYHIKLWSSFWHSESLARSGQRPRKGDVIELQVKKNIWNERHQFVVSDPYPNTFCKVHWRKE